MFRIFLEKNFFLFTRNARTFSIKHKDKYYDLLFQIFI